MHFKFQVTVPVKDKAWNLLGEGSNYQSDQQGNLRMMENELRSVRIEESASENPSEERSWQHNIAF